MWRNEFKRVSAGVTMKVGKKGGKARNEETDGETVSRRNRARRTRGQPFRRCSRYTRTPRRDLRANKGMEQDISVARPLPTPPTPVFNTNGNK